MLRHVVLLLFALHPSFARTSVAQDTLADTLRSGFRLSGDRLRRLPIDDPRHALVLIPGVRLTSPDIGVTPTATLLIRGSAAGRSNVYVDGAPLRFQTLGGAGVGLAPNAIADISVLTGVAPAFLGDASGGVIAYETRSGGERLAGDLRWDSDEAFSDASSVGYNRIEGVLGGPIARGGKLTFFLSTTLQGQRSSYRGLDASATPAYMPAGTDTIVNSGGTTRAIPLLTPVNSGLRRPFDWSTARRAHAKVHYGYGNGSSLALTLLDGDVQQRFFPGQLALDPALYNGQRLWSAAAILNWRHQLGSWHAGPLALLANASIVRNRYMSGPIDSASALIARDPSLGIAFGRLRFAGADILGLPTSETLVRDVRTGLGLRAVPFPDKPDATQVDRTNPYGIATANQWPSVGFGGTLTDVAERRIQGRWSLEWSPVGKERVTVGVEVEHSHVSSYSSDVVRLLGTDVFNAHPHRVGVFSDAHLRLAEAGIDIGVRYDRITPGGEVPVIPAYISSSGPALWNPSAATDDTAYANSVARVFRRARTKTAVSPSIRFTYPIGTKTDIRLGYSRHIAPPTWGTFFVHSNNDLAFTNAFDLFGHDIDFVVASLIEGGARYAVGRTVLNIGLFRKDLPVYGGTPTQFTDPRDTTKTFVLSTVTPFTNTHAQGIDLGVEWRGGWVTATGAYSLTRTTTQPISGFILSAPFTTQDLAIVAILQVPNDWMGGTVLGAIARDVQIQAFGRVQSGVPYTRLVNNGLGILATDGGFGAGVSPGTTINSSELPSLKRLDLRIAKSVRTAGHDWSIYIDARNLLNLSNLMTLFAETGDTANAQNRERTIGDPSVASGEYAALWNEAQTAGALAAGNSVDLSGCASWGRPADCVALTRVERRFGNGDKVFTLAEQQRTFNAFYHDFFGAWRFYAPGRTIRIGMELAL